MYLGEGRMQYQSKIWHYDYDLFEEYVKRLCQFELEKNFLDSFDVKTVYN